MIYTDKKLAGEISPRYFGGVIDFFARINLSIRSKILLSFFIVIASMSTIYAALIFQMLSFNEQYDAIITNITTANSINGYIKPAIDSEMWNVVAGKKAFAEGDQYTIIEDVNLQLWWMKSNTASDRAKIKIDVILRTMDTLTRYVDRMGDQMAQGSRAAENELLLENIREVSGLVEGLVQEYMLFEVNRAEQNYRIIQDRFVRWAMTSIILLVGVLGFSVGAAWIISESIYVPIKKLHDVTTTIAENDLQVLVTSDNANEIADLRMSFNVMIGKIKELLDSKIKEQENLKKAEFRTLQAQITPHFLYNTLDTIIWLAEAKQTEEVIEIVSALSSFFRITLSKGQDWITIRDEVEHTRSYLTIQKMRYRDILDYVIEVDEAVLDSTILKLTLQPLVENALYHGIKNKRQGGTITVRVKQYEADCVLLEVEDDGIGFTPVRLAQIEAEINEEMSDMVKIKESGFGLENVNKRIKLYYGKAYGLSIDSKYQLGTQVRLVIPRIPYRTAVAGDEDGLTGRMTLMNGLYG